jgi:caffeoyl-CoA O-methyltransferase
VLRISGFIVIVRLYVVNSNIRHLLVFIFPTSGLPVFRTISRLSDYFCKMEPIHPSVQAYADRFSATEDALLHAVAAQTYASHPQAHMLSGQVQGKFLEMISSLMQPRRILEIGTFTGYSALCLVKGLSKDGLLHTIELREEDAAVSKANFDRSSASDKIILHTGNALSIIPSLDETWDLVFIDADKVGYINYYELVLPKLRSGGIILADNVLFHGQVLEQPVTGKSAIAIQAFNEHVQQDERVDNVMLTIRDGLMLIRKK